MISRRIAAALKGQDWITIVIELVLVIAGVLIALQLDQWNGARADRAQEIQFLVTVRDDIKQDITDVEGSIQALTAVLKFGNSTIASRGEEACIDQCWSRIVAYFHASQWIDVQLNRATYDEIKRTGLPSDVLLKNNLTSYYNLSEQTTKVSTDLPRYRELVRSIIPAATQEHLWAKCFRIQGRRQHLVADCAPPANENNAREIIDRLRANPEIEFSLNYWLSTVSVVRRTLHNQVAEAKSVVAALTDYVEKAQ